MQEAPHRWREPCLHPSCRFQEEVPLLSAASPWDPTLPGLVLLPASGFQEGVYLTGQVAGLTDDLGRPGVGPPARPILESAAPLSAFTSPFLARPCSRAEAELCSLAPGRPRSGCGEIVDGLRTETGLAPVLVPGLWTVWSRGRAGCISMRPSFGLHAPACGRAEGMAGCPSSLCQSLTCDVRLDRGHLHAGRD